MSLPYPDYDSIIDLYTEGIRSMYGLTPGKVRGRKGKFVESIVDAIVHLAWHEIGGETNRLNIGKRIEPISIKENYVETLKYEYLRHHINRNKNQYIYKVELDRAAEVDSRLVLAIECKAFTDQTMLKRTLKEFELVVKLRHPELIFCIFQLENGLGGDYGEASNPKQLGSKSTHTLMSHSPAVSLEIITLLDGNHNQKRLIHNPKYFKELPVKNVAVCVSKFRTILEDFA